MKLSELIKITGANCITPFEKDFDVSISTDTRTIKKGDFYLPLKGASFDGEKFIEQAIEKGAIGSFCTDDSISINKSVDGEPIPLLLQVPDTLVAYLQLANYRRRQLDFTVVAITGSSGKTTTKEIIASTLGSKYKVFKTPLNHNNEIGLCQTIFATPKDTDVLVLEMGMRGLGEIELLSKYAEPDITIISNIGTAHIGRLGSRENIAKAKCEIVKYQRGNIFIAHNDELIKKTIDFDGEKIYYSINDVNILEKNVDYSIFEYKNNIYKLNVSGDYNIENALSAINVGIKLGLNIEEIKKGLEQYRPIEKRWESVFVNGFEIINDSYNANPESMRAFLNTIFELYNDYVIVLGDMGELGENEKQYHAELGKYIFKNKPDAKILTVGNLSQNISNSCNGIHFNNIEDSAEYIKNNISKTSKIFLKASRSMKFEKFIDLLLNT